MLTSGSLLRGLSAVGRVRLVTASAAATASVAATFAAATRRVHSESATTSEPSVAELFSLKGRTALVTGGSQGLGKAIARGLALAGADVSAARARRARRRARSPWERQQATTR